MILNMIETDFNVQITDYKLLFDHGLILDLKNYQSEMASIVLAFGMYYIVLLHDLSHRVLFLKAF